MQLVFALDDAAQATIALVVVFFVVFPAIATGLIAFAISQALGERQDNLERRRFRR
jgi:hypothetical protein